MTRIPAVSHEGVRSRQSDERRRLEECATEPIRTCGRIQSHGILFGVDESTNTVVIASEGADHWLGAPLSAIEDGELASAVSAGSVLDPQRVEFEGSLHDVIVHRGADPLLVELEPVVAGLEYRRTGVVSAIQRLATLTDPDELRREAAREIKAVTGFDRVMCYEFLEDGHGRIVADEREEEMESYLGLHFPASDIPVQARALYIEKRSRAIVDTEDGGRMLRSTLPSSVAVDLGPTELRSASPHHLQFMRNMGQVSTVSFALVAGDQLIGMFTCAHRSRYRVPVLLRRAVEVLAAQVAMQLQAAREIERLRRELDARARRAGLIAPLYGPSDIGDVLLGGVRTVRDVVPADAVLLRVGSHLRVLGTAASQAERIATAADELGVASLATENLSLEHLAIARRLPEFAGMLIVPLSDDGDCLVFLRGELAQEVSWLGDQNASNRDDTLSPRRSFSAWRESVTGQCAPWGAHTADAAHLGDEIRVARAGREQAELAELALQDALTGLGNRRVLHDRLADLVEGATPFAVVFLDLDGFKGINDTYGHEAGDAVLVTVGKRLSSGARSSDLVVRLGGDEFVIVCPDSDFASARSMAERLLASLTEPIAAQGAIICISASAGIVMATEGHTAAGVLADADAAMYRAKRSDRGRLSA